MDKHEIAARAREGLARRRRERMGKALELRGKGYSWRQVAERFGLRDVRGFKLRVSQYARENDLEVPEAPEMSQVLLGVLDEIQGSLTALQAKVDEIRRRYE